MIEGPATLENRTFDEIAVGDSASVTKTLTRDDITLFAAVSGDVNPIHLDERLAEARPAAARRRPQPVGRPDLGPARHVGIACAALATDGVKLITGNALYVDGGLHVLG